MKDEQCLRNLCQVQNSRLATSSKASNLRTKPDRQFEIQRDLIFWLQLIILFSLKNRINLLKKTTMTVF